MTMLEMLVDTSALIAFFVRSEKHHEAARRYVHTHRETRWVILETVFDETVTWFRAKVSIADSIAVGHVLRSEHRYYQLSADDDDAVWDAFRRYDDKAWSYTDCSLLVMAQRLEIPHVFAFDAHINQMAGLGIVPLPNTGI
jgi:uncharacterized protein